jgi:hypothetical protein
MFQSLIVKLKTLADFFYQHSNNKFQSLIVKLKTEEVNEGPPRYY